MKKQKNDEVTEEQMFDLFCQRIMERQALEEQYYQTGDPLYLPQIAEARARIREAVRKMGIKADELIE